MFDHGLILVPDERARYYSYGGAGPVGTGPIQRTTYKNIVSVMKSAIVTSRTSLRDVCAARLARVLFVLHCTVYGIMYFLTLDLGRSDQLRDCNQTILTKL